MRPFRRSARERIPIQVRLSLPLQPAHRGIRFEDPFQEAIEKASPGSEVVGGGSEVSEEYRITGCYIDIEMASSDVEEALQLVGDTFYKLGATRGSWISAYEARRVPVGGLDAFSIRVLEHGMEDIDGETDGVPHSEALLKAMRQLTAALGTGPGIVSWRMNPVDTDIFIVARISDDTPRLLAEAISKVPFLERHEIVRFE